MSSIPRKRSRSESLDAPPTETKLVLKFPKLPSTPRMSLKQAIEVGANWNKELFARHTEEESVEARTKILSAFSAKYKKLDEVIKTQDSAIEQSKAAVLALEFVMNINKFSSRRMGADLLPEMAKEKLDRLLQSIIGVNGCEMVVQHRIANNAEKTRIVANAAKMMLAESEKLYLLPYFITDVAKQGCDVELGDYTGRAATQRTTRTWVAKMALEEMCRIGTIRRWWLADKAEVDDVMALDIGTLFE